MRAEVFVVALVDRHPVLSGPCGAEPWLIEAGGEEHPMATVERLAKAAVDPVHVSHSTSWRHDAGAVVLSFVVVTDADAVEGRARVEVPRADLARGRATSAPTEIGWAQVLEHGLRHLSWLLRDDEHVRDALPTGWEAVLADYVPEPFRMLTPRG